jgi:succinate-semialdehyde dehydrogenase/glutarate-semialdehyde dehydrogenase
MPSPSFQVVNPATGEESAPHPFITDTELEAVLSTARDIQREWASWAAPARAKILNDVARYHRNNLEELATIAVREMGKPITQARAEVEFSADIYDYYADNGTAFLADEPIAVSGSGSALIRKQPIGTVLGIMPWNFPYYQVARFAAPALMAGNSVLLKPAPQCPDSSASIAYAFSVAPQGVFTRILASESAIANLIEDTRVAGVSFTGSERAGAIIGGLAGAAVKKTVLELGGSDPFLVLDVTSVDTTARNASSSSTGTMTNSCASSSNTSARSRPQIRCSTTPSLAHCRLPTPPRGSQPRYSARSPTEQPLCWRPSDGARSTGAGCWPM